MGRPVADPLTRAAWSWLGVPALRAAVALAARRNDKARRLREGRQGADERLAQFAPRLRGGVWVHSASAGEYEQARPLLRAIAERWPQRPRLVTVYSPSGLDHAGANPDFEQLELLPADDRTTMERWVAALAPAAVAFVKYDAWPNLVWECARAGVPALLLGASLPATSRRHRPPFSHFTRAVYRSLSAIGAADEGSAHRLQRLMGGDPPVVECGDTRAAQVLHRLQQRRQEALVGRLAGARWRWLLLGSSWEADEELALAALAGGDHDRWGVIVVPHEPTPDHLRELETRLEGLGLGHSRLSALPADGALPRALVVDRTGILADLYPAAAVAWVGGGFGDGVHSVLEPAACSLPVLFGPRHHNAAEAARLLSAGAAAVATDGASAARALGAWLPDDAAAAAAGAAARRTVERMAADSVERNLALLAPYLEGSA